MHLSHLFWLYNLSQRPQVPRFYYKKRSAGHNRNGKDDSSPKIQPPSSPLSRQSLSTSAIPTYHAGEQCWSRTWNVCAIHH